MYTILVNDYENGIEDAIVFEGRKPFITRRKEVAEVYMEELEKEFPKAFYKLVEMRVI